VLLRDARFEVVLIAACAHGGVIGANNQLPWHLPEDLAHFKSLTTGHCIIMGRKTFESIGRALPHRRSIVISRQAGASALHAIEGIETAASLEEALALSQTASGDTALSPVFIIGGAQLYAQAIHWADRIELTEIDLTIEGDAFFPEISSVDWDKSVYAVSTDPKISRSGVPYRFLTCRRKSGKAV
jgi:dihydrofolate reductase